MLRTSLILTATAGALLALAQPVMGQSVGTTNLTEPDATFPEPLSAIRGLRELSDGRVVVTDMIEQSVRILDFRTGGVAEIGRQGNGPGEYGMPGELFALAGDTTWMMDMANRRFMVILPTGRIDDNTVSVRPQTGFPIMARGVDQQGRVYFDLSGIMAPGMEDIVQSGRAPIIRWDPRTEESDTIGVTVFPPMRVPGGRARAGEVRISLGGGGGPYASRDAWGVTSDGRVGIARSEDYHVEWLSAAGPAVTGPEIAIQPIKIGRAEKEAWADSRTQGIAVVVENGRRRTMRPPRPDIDEQEWPDVMPAFASASVTPEGELWVQRSRPAREQRRTFDVFDAAGNLVRQVVLPEGRRLVGFGNGTLYAILVDDDDLQWIERYQR